MEKLFETVINNLKKNNMKGFYAENCSEAKEIVKSLLKDGETVSMGGSVSLAQCGIKDLLRNGNYTFLDREKEGLTKDDVEKIYRDTFSADTYFASANAITQNGELFNVDGNANRVAAIMFGPKSVILIVGRNKITDNIEQAFLRVKTIAAPKNCVRLSKDTFCAKSGHCIASNNPAVDVCSGCNSEQRICRDYVVLGPQGIKDRIKVILVNEDLGY